MQFFKPSPSVTLATSDRYFFVLFFNESDRLTVISDRSPSMRGQNRRKVYCMQMLSDCDTMTGNPSESMRIV